jgi:hypothetical protein
MSAVSELREQVALQGREIEELHTRLEIVEKLLLDYVKRVNIQDLSTELIRVEDEDDFENRTPIGYKVPNSGTKKKPTR